jgi:AcrR family transcriptional regulator
MPRRTSATSSPATRRLRTPEPALAPVPAGDLPAAAGARESRGARRKRETRTRLLEAALQLMAVRGMEGVAINEITEVADVGFGSFYNHFESKEAIYDALMDVVFEGFADALDALVREVTDPAEIVAFSVRHTLLRARREPLWGQFLLREGLSTRALTRGLGQRLLRDLSKGVATRRFKAPDLLMSFVAVGGTVLAAISAQQQAGADDDPQAALVQQMGLSLGDIPERAATIVLTTLGIDQAEAERMARKPLPTVELKTA